ncbi:hypothetical protein M1558_03400, partial [Candidatus Parvarchaeota archaeon]|nr:hypothetical protein [Candidatus Parvarchaeota archaeon]
WAILIIVIVAVILYSMGIFNPRASVTASSSGFSPFAASAAICSTSGLKVSFSVGGLPDGATAAILDNLTLSSPSGFTSGIPATVYSATGVADGDAFSSTTVASGNSFTVNDSTAICSTSGVPFTASGKLDYSVTTAAGTAVFTATGTIAGTSS